MDPLEKDASEKCCRLGQLRSISTVGATTKFFSGWEFGTGMAVVNIWLKFLAMEWKIPDEDHFSLCVQLLLCLYHQGLERGNWKICRREGSRLERSKMIEKAVRTNWAKGLEVGWIEFWGLRWQ